jgi:hypothetical protein
MGYFPTGNLMYFATNGWSGVSGPERGVGAGLGRIEKSKK